MSPQSECPLAAIDRRLEDVHRQWHSAEHSYFDPDEFRRNIQAVIQTLRTVTFILQKNKELIPGYGPWYQEWQDRLRSDPLMRWMVDARNKIEKEGDLEAKSFVQAQVMASYLDEGPILEVEAHLFQNPDALLAHVFDKNLAEHFRQNGVLNIQRKWVENSLPEYELLEAAARAFGRISELVDDAHRQAGLPVHDVYCEDGQKSYSSGRHGRLPCMIGHEDFRSLNVALKDSSRLTLRSQRIDFDPEVAKQSMDRYGLDPETSWGKASTLLENFRQLFSVAKTMTEKDGTHLSTVFLFSGSQVIDFQPFAVEDQAQKYMVMRSLAKRAVQRGADGAVLILEAWTGRRDKSNPYRRPSEMEERGEALVGMMATKDGNAVHLISQMDRSAGGVVMGETIELDEGAPFILAPLYTAWGKPHPPEWKSMEQKSLEDQDDKEPE